MDIHDIKHHRVDFPGDLRREPPREVQDRQPGYEERFDYTTLFSDAFLVEEGLELLGPPLLNTREEVASAVFEVDGSVFRGTVTSEDRHRISRTILEGVTAASKVTLRLPGGDVEIEVNQAGGLFRGARVLMTQQKNNPLEWIAYWVNYHVVHHGIDSVVLYDNQSATYNRAELVEALRSVNGLRALAVIDWDVPFGVTGGPSQVWDSDFGQHQALEHAMRFVLSDAACVIQQDVDELVLTESGESVCDMIIDSDLGEIRYPRRQIFQVTYPSVAPEDERGFRLHCDYAYYRADGPALAAKYVCVPSRIPRNAHFLAHGVDGATREIRSDVVARHYGALRIEWRKGQEEPVGNAPLGHVNFNLSADHQVLESYRSVPEPGARGVPRTSKFGTLRSVERGGLDVPVNTIYSLDDLPAPPVGSVSRWRLIGPPGRSIDFLLMRKRSDALVTSYHGALDRARFELPRFERLATLGELDVSSLYFSDPLLETDDSLELGWFQGTDGDRIIERCVAITRKVAELSAAKSVVHTGSAGGGFAALRAASLLAGSFAAVFNPQTSIGGYLAGGSSFTAQRAYLKAVWPDVYERCEGRVEDIDSFASVTSRDTSVFPDFETPVSSTVLYCNNVNDFHVEQHYLPFLAAAARGDNLGRIRLFEYDGPTGHAPPSPEQFVEGVSRALRMARSAV